MISLMPVSGLWPRACFIALVRVSICWSRPVIPIYSAAFGGGSDARLQLGLVFSSETVFSNNIGERDSILNLEHGFIQ